MPFVLEDCAIPTLWCGNGNTPRRNARTWYTRKGTSYECLKKGVGLGKYTTLKKDLPEDSLQHIKYVGEYYEQQFIRYRITTQTALQQRMRGKDPIYVRDLLRKVFTKTDGTLDTRGYNQTLVYLYDHGITDLPTCYKIRP